MRKTATMFGIGLLVWMLAAVAFAGPAGLLNTNWVGVLTVVDSEGNITSDNSTKVTLTFTDENGEFLAGTISSPSLSFSFACLRDGRSLQMTGPNYLMSGEIFKGRYHPKRGTPPTQNMTIQGSGLAEGIMFQGVLTQQQQ